MGEEEKSGGNGQYLGREKDEAKSEREEENATNKGWGFRR